MLEWLTRSPRQCVINMQAWTSTCFNSLERPIVPLMSQHHHPLIEAWCSPGHCVKPGQKNVVTWFKNPMTHQSGEKGPITIKNSYLLRTNQAAMNRDVFLAKNL